MKYLLSFVVGGLLLTTPLTAQQAITKSNLPVSGSGQSKSETVEKSISAASFRGKIVAESAVNDLESAAWSRSVYRVVSDSLEVNGPLFTPTTSNKEQANLFSLLISLLRDQKIKAYRFNVDNTSLSEAEEISLSEILESNNIPYASAGTSISVNPYDLPSNEVLNYYVREQWYFDSKTGQGGATVKAICPVLFKKDNDIAATGVANVPTMKVPLFWVSFDEVSPYLVRASINNAFSDLGKEYNVSMFDFFRMRNYKGAVYRIGNRVLAEHYATPEDVALEQANIEDQLKQIDTTFSRFK